MSHLLVSWQGNSPGGEVWSTGLRFCAALDTEAPITPGLLQPSGSALQAMADGIGALNTNKGFPTRAINDLSAALDLASIRVSWLDSQGVLGSAAEYTFPTPVHGSDSMDRPLQVALVMTLNQGAQYGRHYRGRMFLPSIAGPPLDTQGRVAATARTDRLVEWATFIDQVATVIDEQAGGGGVIYPIVWSRTTKLARTVNNLAMGDVLDTQRRRRDRLREARTVVPLPITN